MESKHDRKTRSLGIGEEVAQALAFHSANATATERNCGARLLKTTVEEVQQRLGKEGGARSLQKCM